MTEGDTTVPAATISLTSLDGADGFELRGEAAVNLAGQSVSSAGDVNGDGYGDFIVGAGAASPNGVNAAGAAYVVFGKASGFPTTLDLSSLDGTNGFKISGATAGDGVGSSVATAGDVNGDGFADLIVGPDGIHANASNTRAGYVIYGRQSGFAANLDVSTLNGSSGFKINDLPVSSGASWSVASADLNGDGFPDLIVGAPHAFTVGWYAGATYVIFGKASGTWADTDLSSLNGVNGLKISGAAPEDFSGASVAAAGDVNGDGIGDLIIGESGNDQNGPNSGSAYVVYGTASTPPANSVLSQPGGLSGFKVSGEAAGDFAGGSVAGAGDINGDGFADIIVGAPFASASYVVFGGPGGASNVDLSSLDGSNGFKIIGEAAGDFLGKSVASAGDVNGDGFDDLIVGGSRADAGGADSGAAYVIYGKASGFSASLDLASLDGTNGFKLLGGAANARSGSSVASAGDVNGDGLADVVVGAPGAASAGAYTGAAYVVFGALPDTSVSRVGTDTSQHLVGGNFDDLLSGLGGDDNLYGHGGADVLLGGLGDDTIDGGPGNDMLDGGSGLDTASYASAASAVAVSLAVVGPQDTVGAGTDTLISIENLTGSASADTLTGDYGPNVLQGGGGGDTIDGGAGDDDIRGDGVNDSGNDVLNGGAGNDYIEGGPGSDVIHGGSGDDAIYASAGPRTLTPYAAAPVSTPGGSLDILYGDSGNDLLVSVSVPDQSFVVMYGGDGDDHLVSTSKFTFMYGDAGDDTLEGSGTTIADYQDSTAGVIVDLRISGPQDTVGAGVDTLSGMVAIYGSAFNDGLTGDGSDSYLMGGAGADTIDGQGGSDTASYFECQTGVIVDLTVTGPQDTGDGVDTLISIENLDGSFVGNDVLTGDPGANTLRGWGGDDVLSGGSGPDTLDGGTGNDTIDGGGGDDTAVFAGPRSAYSITSAGLSTIVTDFTSGPLSEGIDKLANVEHLQFADQTISVPKPTAGNDLTGDGKADILWRNAMNGDLYLFASSPNAVAAPGQDLGLVGSNWHVDQVADFDGDGKADILWRNYGNGDSYLWTSSGNAVAAPGQDLGIVGLQWQVQDVEDFNGDGKADILWRNMGNGDVYLFTSSPNAVAAPGIDLGIVAANWSII